MQPRQTISHQPLGGGAEAIGLSGPAQAHDHTETAGNPVTPAVVFTAGLIERTLPSASPTWELDELKAVAVAVAATASLAAAVKGLAEKSTLGKFAALVI